MGRRRAGRVPPAPPGHCIGTSADARLSPLWNPAAVQANRDRTPGSDLNVHAHIECRAGGLSCSAYRNRKQSLRPTRGGFDQSHVPRPIRAGRYRGTQLAVPRGTACSPARAQPGLRRPYGRGDAHLLRVVHGVVGVRRPPRHVPDRHRHLGPGARARPRPGVAGRRRRAAQPAGRHPGPGAITPFTDVAFGCAAGRGWTEG